MRQAGNCMLGTYSYKSGIPAEAQRHKTGSNELVKHQPTSVRVMERGKCAGGSVRMRSCMAANGTGMLMISDDCRGVQQPSEAFCKQTGRAEFSG